MPPRDRQGWTRIVSDAWGDLPCPGRARAAEVIEQLRIELDPTSQAPSVARRGLQSLSVHLTAQSMDDAMVLVSELVTNSVVHARVAGPIEVEGFLLPDAIAVSVADGGKGFDPTALLGSRPGAPGGRGLELVVALASALGIDSRDPFRVWFAMTRPAYGGPRPSA